MMKILEIIKSMLGYMITILPQFKDLKKIEIVLFSEFSPLCLTWQICSIWSRYSAFFTLVLAVPLERPLAFPIKFYQMAVAFWRTLHFILFHYIFKVSKYSTNSFFYVLHEFRQKKIIKATYKIRRFFKDFRNLKILYFFYDFAIIEKLLIALPKKIRKVHAKTELMFSENSRDMVYALFKFIFRIRFYINST